MVKLGDIKLVNCDDEDIFDVVIKLEKSFGIKFSDTAFRDVKTFGDLCDVIESHITYDNRDDCTKQQAFYKIRNAISATQFIGEKQIKLNSRLDKLFPVRNRRTQVKEFQNQLGIKVSVLTYPGWLGNILGIGILLSLVAFFFDWKVAVSGIVLFVSGIKIADFFGNVLKVQTVQQLAEKVAREHYIDVRRSKDTVNRKEILKTIEDAFSNDLAIDKVHLTKGALFGWSKKGAAEVVD